MMYALTVFGLIVLITVQLVGLGSIVEKAFTGVLALSHIAFAEKTPQPEEMPAPVVKETRTFYVTAYSSTIEETDDTPFITANGTYVHDGIVATNMLPFGTRVQIPSAFGDKIFTVEDRMHQKRQGYVDVWMSSKTAAQQFGITRTEVLVLEQ